MQSGCQRDQRHALHPVVALIVNDSHLLLGAGLPRPMTELLDYIIIYNSHCLGAGPCRSNYSAPRGDHTGNRGLAVISVARCIRRWRLSALIRYSILNGRASWPEVAAKDGHPGRPHCLPYPPPPATPRPHLAAPVPPIQQPASRVPAARTVLGEACLGLLPPGPQDILCC